MPEGDKLMSNEPSFSLSIDHELELRLMADAEADELFALIEENRVRLRQWLPWVDYEASSADSLEFIQRSRQQYLGNESFQLGIFYHGRLAGVIGCHTIDWSNRRVEIGYWLAAAFEGQGLMTRACRVLVDYAFEKLMLNRVEILCAVNNVRSRAIPERLGFIQEGIRREGEWLYDHFVDLVVYSMLAREWSQRFS
jgi:ribosomal-protein-serine acetyltransferase